MRRMETPLTFERDFDFRDKLRNGIVVTTTLVFFTFMSLLLLPVGVLADEADEEEIEEVVVTGVRGKPTTVQDSPVPIDVFRFS